jgi:oligopeptide transport system permease protein
MRLAPGGPFDSERALDPEISKNLRRIYRLDLPLMQQFWLYLQSLAHGDLGPSLHWRDFSVNELFAKALPISAALGAKAMLVAIIAGTALGLVGATSKGRIGPYAVDGAAIFGVVLPVFVVAPVLQLGFGLTLHALPVGGWNDGAWQNQVLPVMTLALPQIAIVARLMQAALRDALAMPHIRTLRAFGMPGYHMYLILASPPPMCSPDRSWSRPFSGFQAWAGISSMARSAAITRLSWARSSSSRRLSFCSISSSISSSLGSIHAFVMMQGRDD